MRASLFADKFLRTLCVAFSASVVGLAGCDQAESDQTAPPSVDPVAEGCAALSLEDALPQPLAALSEDMNVLEALPLSGVSVYDTVVSHANQIQGCVVSRIDSRLVGEYNHADRRLTIRSDTSTTTTAHEAFHAIQYLNGAGSFKWEGTLTARDTIFASFLMEATAAAYELVIEKEAQLEGYALPRPTHDGVAASHGMRAAFDRGYAEALEEEYANETERRQAALSRGGQTAVYYLMRGNSSSWGEYYATNIEENWRHYVYREEGCSEAYLARRNVLLSRIGEVSSGINLVPANYLNAGADAEIRESFTEFFNMSPEALNNRCTPPKRGMS